MTERKRKPEPIGKAVTNWLDQSGLRGRIDQAAVVPEWRQLVGPQIAEVTQPQSITGTGTLFVLVKTNAWMNELSLLEPELLRSLNRVTGRTPIRRIRWQLGGL